MGVTKHFCPWMLLHPWPCLSPSLCCHSAATPSTHYLMSCGISESVGPEERKKKQKRLTTAAKLRWQKQSPCPSTDYIRNCRDVNHALISSVLQRRSLCGKIAAACEAAFVRQRQSCACASVYIHGANYLILQSFRCEPCQLYTVYSYPLCMSQMELLSQRFV